MIDPDDAPAAKIEATAHTAEIETAVEAAAAPKDYASILNAWQCETLANSPAARDTAAWNFLTTTAIPALLKRLHA